MDYEIKRCEHGQPEIKEGYYAGCRARSQQRNRYVSLTAAGVASQEPRARPVGCAGTTRDKGHNVEKNRSSVKVTKVERSKSSRIGGLPTSAKLIEETKKTGSEMKFAEVTARLVVDENNTDKATEELHTAQDRLALEGIPVFDSDVYSKPVCAVENEEVVRADAEASKVDQETSPAPKRVR